MLVTNGILAHRYDEQRHPDFRLGRHLELDSRSLAYLAPTIRVPIKPAEHLPCIATLNQGSIGSCTGNAGSYALSALVGSAGLSEIHLDGQSLSGNSSQDNEPFALALYHEATVRDGFPGTYPPTDEGSSGLGVCRALRKAGLVKNYLWATNRQGLGTLLQKQGVMLGTPWLNAFFQPDVRGFVDADSNWANSGVAGGHEIYIEALEAWDDRDASKCVIRFRNSWGQWGDNGCGRMRLSTYEALKSQSDCKQLVK